MKVASVKVERLTHGSDHYFYGYYDNPAWSRDGKWHLAHRVKFWDRLPAANDKAEIGLIRLNDDEFQPIAETSAWNFQQGAMLQWNPLKPNEEILFNIRCGEGYCGAVLNVYTGQQRLLEKPIANVDPTGKYALSVSFDRMFQFRPGYGYCSNLTDAVREAADADHPHDDGVWRVDLTSGRSELILSLHQIWEFTKAAFHGQNQKILINHINFNTDGTRFVMLVRNFPKPGERWSTAAVTANADGSDLHLLLDYSLVSHYHWKDRDHLVIFCKHPASGTNGLYVLKDRTNEIEAVDSRFFVFDGHCSYSPDRKWLLYDSYPDKDSFRHLYLYDLEAKTWLSLGSFYSDPISTGDYRCDLHPRWNAAGTAVSFDSTHEGQRHIYMMDLKEILS